MDAEHVDVYKGAHSAIILYDVNARATWEHAKALAAAVPPSLPVLLLGNFRDAAPPTPTPATVGLPELNAFVQSANAHHASSKKPSLLVGKRFFGFEVSTRECFGLKTLYN